MNSLLSRIGFPSPSKMMTAQRALQPPTPEQVAAMSTSAVAVAVVAEVEAPPPVPEPPKEVVPVPDAEIASTAEMGDELRAQYVALASELGVTQPGLLKDAAKAFFRDRGTRLYDHAKVHAYLDDQYGKETEHEQVTGSQCNCCKNGMHVNKFHAATWGWRPLRASDRHPEPPPRPQQSNGMFIGGWGDYLGSTENNAIWNGWYIATYAKPLPLPVLLTAKEVVTAFPSAKCFVSDDMSKEAYQAGLRPVLDPFLMVVIEDERFIIERWDEPAYRE